MQMTPSLRAHKYPITVREPQNLHLRRGHKPYADLLGTSPQSREASSLGLHGTGLREHWQEKVVGQAVIAYTIVSHACGVNNLTKSAKRLARGLGRSGPQTLRWRNRLYRQHLAEMSFHIDWQAACGISNRGRMELCGHAAALTQ
jgi:hypothetical protein